MEENMTNAHVGSNAEMEAAKTMYAEWKKNKETTTKTKSVSKEDILKKYFTPRDEKETFRPVHPNINEQYIKFAFFHEVYLNKAEGERKTKTKIYCPSHNDPQVQATDDNGQLAFTEQGKAVMVDKYCPICEKAKLILKKQDNVRGKEIAQKLKNKQELTEEERKIKESNDKLYKQSKAIEAKKFYMVKGVDRGREKDGPKFWRFKHRFRNDGDGDKLIPILFGWSEANGIHFANPEKGIDVNISMGENTIPNTNYTYPVVTAVNTDPRGPSPLHRDPDIVKAWLADKTTWRDVFRPKEYKFMDAATLLDRIAKGTDPYWDETDKNNKKWVFPDPRDAELAIKVNTRSINFDASSLSNFERASDMPTNESAAYSAVNNSYEPSMYDVDEDEASYDSEDAENITQQSKKEFNEVKIQNQSKPEETKVNNLIGNKDIESLDLPF
jgi:hypothetical protein